MQRSTGWRGGDADPIRLRLVRRFRPAEWLEWGPVRYVRVRFPGGAVLYCWDGGAAKTASSEKADGSPATKVNHFYNGSSRPQTLTSWTRRTWYSPPTARPTTFWRRCRSPSSRMTSTGRHNAPDSWPRPPQEPSHRSSSAPGRNQDSGGDRSNSSSSRNARRSHRLPEPLKTAGQETDSSLGPAQAGPFLFRHWPKGQTGFGYTTTLLAAGPANGESRSNDRRTATDGLRSARC